jgi:hypothetical protein
MGSSYNDRATGENTLKMRGARVGVLWLFFIVHTLLYTLRTPGLAMLGEVIARYRYRRVAGPGRGQF